MNKLLIYLLILPFLFFLLTPISHLLSPICYAYPPGWSDDILLTPEDDEERGLPDVAVDRYNNVWAVWDSATWINGTGEVLYSKRDSLGNCLISETAVSNNSSYSILSRIAVDNSDNVHFIWRDASPQGFGIWHAKLANDGLEIVPSHLAVSGAGGFSSSLEPEIAFSKYKHINVAWDEYKSGYNQMNYTKLDSLGDTLIAKIQVSPVDLNAYWVGIGVDSFANSHLACRTDSGGISNRLTYSKLDKDGDILVANKILGFGSRPTIIADRNQNIHMVYTDPTGPGSRIEYLKLDNDGNILIGPKTISLPQINSNTYAHMAIDSLQYLHIVWQADSSADVHIMYAKLDTLGNFIISPMKIVYPYQGVMPRIAVDQSNRLHVVWIDGRLNPGGDIFYKRGENDTGVEETAGRSTPDAIRLEVFPNPFTQITDIRYEITEYQRQEPRGKKQDISLEIYDITGRLIRTISVNLCNLNNSVESVSWHGDDDSGNHLPAGIYFVRVTFPNITQTIPVVLLR